MNPLQVAALCFIAIKLCMFIVGAVDASRDVTSEAELYISIVVAGAAWAIPDVDVTFGNAVLGAGLGVFAATGWSALQFWKLRVLGELATGRRR
jgi:hypothetical protein